MKTKLRAVPDYLTNSTDEIVKRMRFTLKDEGSVGPALFYLDPCGHQFSLPLDYDDMVRIGREMSAMTKAAFYMAQMGAQFGFYAMQVAQRASDPRLVAEDREFFLATMNHMLWHSAPAAFFVAIPTVIVVGAATPASIAEIAAAGPNHPDAKNALVVVGRNMVRGYAVVTPFEMDADKGLVTYDKPYTIDSSRGEHIGCLGPFSSIYDPSQN
jgi:hypothetical protein